MRFSLLAGLLLAAFLVAGPALADRVRTPDTGTPALSIDAPAGWEVRHEAIGLLLVQPDGGRVVAAGVVGGLSAPLDEVAAAVISQLGSPPYSHSEAEAVGGLAGKAYDTTAVNNAGVSARMRLVLAQVDPTHVLVVYEITRADLPPTDAEALHAITATVTIER
jgi:hypothetical protein